MDFNMGLVEVYGLKALFIKDILKRAKNMEVVYLFFKMEKNTFKENFKMMFLLVKLINNPQVFHKIVKK